MRPGCASPRGGCTARQCQAVSLHAGNRSIRHRCYRRLSEPNLASCPVPFQPTQEPCRALAPSPSHPGGPTPQWDRGGQAVLPALPGQHRHHTCDYLRSIHKPWKKKGAEEREWRCTQTGDAASHQSSRAGQVPAPLSPCPNNPAGCLSTGFKRSWFLQYHNPLFGKAELQQQWYFKQ